MPIKYINPSFSLFYDTILNLFTFKNIYDFYNINKSRLFNNKIIMNNKLMRLEMSLEIELKHTFLFHLLYCVVDFKC